MQEPMVILVTGGSSGLGKSICQHLHAAGHRVYGTGRSIEPGTERDGIPFLQLDVNDDASVRQAVDELLNKEGHIDVLINNAGIGIQGPLEDTSVEMAEKAFATNLFGLHRVTRSVLPAMRKAESGTIVNVSSIGAHMGLPYRGFYSASKAAVGQYSEALSIELQPFGINVVTLEPGDFQSNIAGARVKPETIGEAYQSKYEQQMRVLDEQMKHAPSPGSLAQKVLQVVDGSNNSLVIRAGAPLQKLAVHLKYWMPTRWFRNLLRKNGES